MNGTQDSGRATYRERRQAKAERLRDWADSREDKAETARARVDEIAGVIPMGQPILVGHHSEKRHRRDADRIHNGMSQAIEHQSKADEFRRRADGIEKAADRAVYSDDEDAVERLTERISGLEAERDVKKAANAKARKGVPPGEWSLSDEYAAQAMNNFKHWPGGTDIPFPDLKNLSANIRRNRKRLEAMKGES